MNNKKFKYLYYVGIFLYLVAFDFCLTNIYRYSKNYMLGDLRIEHPIYHHTLKENSEGGGSINEKYYSNSSGFRYFSKRPTTHLGWSGEANCLINFGSTFLWFKPP